MENNDHFKIVPSVAVQSDGHIVNIHRNPSVVVVEISGELVTGPEIASLHNKIKAELMNAGDNYVVIDLLAVSKTDEPSLRTILDAARRQLGRKFALIPPRGQDERNETQNFRGYLSIRPVNRAA